MNKINSQNINDINTDEKTGVRAVTYPRLFWLFIIGSVMGVIIEGVWYYFMHDRWETHVVTIWGPFCIIYGFGFSGYYAACHGFGKLNIFLRFLIYACLGSGVELICGLLLKYYLNMKAWTYAHYPLNFMGLICVKMTIIWGFVGLVFQMLLPFFDWMLSHMENRLWNIGCIIFSVFLGIDFIVTGACFLRWKERHEGKEPSGRIEEIIDEKYGSDFMKKRFVEWRFIS